MTATTARSEHKYFYVVMAALMLATTVVAFFGSYIAPVSASKPVGPSVVHLHALVAFTWTVLFLVQTSLAAAGRMANHQAMGMFGIAVATAMLFSGLMIATKNMSVGIAGGNEEGARAFAVFPVTIVLLFTGFFAAAIANVGRPEIHKRLMLVATIMTMPPAAGRFLAVLFRDDALPRQIMGAPPATLAGGTAASLAADVFLIVAILYDWRTRGRPHPVYLISLAVIVTVQALRLPLTETPLWRGVTDVLLSLAQ
jgi:hypothetical protein